MEAKEKAKELVDKMYQHLTNFHLGMRKSTAKKQALITVDEMINTVPLGDYKVKKEYESTCREPDYLFQTYWEEVKQEIKKL